MSNNSNVAFFRIFCSLVIGLACLSTSMYAVWLLNESPRSVFPIALLCSLMVAMLLLFWYCASVKYMKDETKSRRMLILGLDSIFFLVFSIWPRFRLPVIEGEELETLALILAVASAAVAMIISEVMAKSLPSMRANKERIQTSLRCSVWPFILWQVIGVAASMLLMVIVESSLFAGLMGVLFSIIVLAIGAVIAYNFLDGSIGMAVGTVVLAIVLVVAFVYPFGSDLGDVFVDFLLRHQDTTRGCFYIVGVAAGPMIAKKEW